MNQYTIDNDGMLWPSVTGSFQLAPKIPVGTYSIGHHPQRGWFLKKIDDLTVPGKVYGRIPRQADRIMNTFLDRTSSTGVLLSGEKGSGKTMLAKIISRQAAEMGIPTIVINAPYTGDGFHMFIQSIDQPVIVLFDEFEKVFDDKEQEATLTLLDGVFPMKKLFILTVNDKYRVNSHMRNRPGRLFYMIEFKGLDAEFIREYCLDNLRDQTHTEQIVRLQLMFAAFNFDMLKALVEEMNRYNESPNQALDMLNAKPIDAGNIIHDVQVFMNGKALATGQFNPARIRGNPVAQDSLEFWVDPEPENDEADTMMLEVTPNNLKKIEPEAGKFTYVLNEGTPTAAVVVFTREQKVVSNYNWLDAF